MTIGVFKVTERSEVTIPKTPNSFFFFLFFIFLFSGFFHFYAAAGRVCLLM